MASSTPNLGLTLPVGGEHVSRQIINANNVKIDEAVGPVPSGTDLQSQVTALNNKIGKFDFDNGLTQITNFNDAPYGFSEAEASAQNTPSNLARFAILTFNVFTTYYKAQIAVADNGIGIFYRYYDLGISSWHAWKSVTLT